MFKYKLIIFLLTTFSAHYAFASVSINEIAWMGDSASANHEWIELYNAGNEQISVEGWTLSDGVNFNLSLTGTISANEYAVLERTSDESAPGLAFLIYTGALVNGGATLVLKDSTGAIRDQVVGGVDWQNIGGDNITKETAQYTEGGWVTDVPTPGYANGGGRAVTTLSTEGATTTTTTTNIKSSGSSSSGSRSSSQSINLKNTETKLALTMNVQSIAYVNQKVPFSARATGLDEVGQRMVKYEWNFGDGYTAETRKEEHVYTYPGSYVVTLYGRIEKSEQTIRQEITVLPVNFSITQNDAGDVQINNNAPYDVDLSGYLLKGVEDFILPARTVILPKATITISASRLGKNTINSMVALYDTKRILVASNFNKKLSPANRSYEMLSETLVALPSPVNTNKTPVVTQVYPEPSAFNFVDKTNDYQPAVTAALANEKIQIDAKEDVLKDSVPEIRWPYLALIALLMFSISGIYVAKATKPKYDLSE